MAINVIVGSIPVVVVGFLVKDTAETTLRSLWFVAGGLIVWSGVMLFAERAATQQRHEAQVNLRDALFIGVAQCLAIIPGVSRSGATISAGLLRDLDRTTATRLSFFLGIPALAAAGTVEAISRHHEVTETVGWTATIIGTVVSFLVAYASIAWLLRFVVRHSIARFVWYRVALGLALAVLISVGAVVAA
jgi:undecaprenyl-diphosphatase